MAATLTTHERFSRIFAHKEADRVPIKDGPWGTTIERWEREGLPKGMDYCDFLDLDKTAGAMPDNGPRLEEKVIEETDQYKIATTSWGATVKNWKHMTSTPDFMDFTVKTPDDWRKIKRRMTPTRDRIDWADLKKNYATWRKEGRWLDLAFWFGFDITHAGFVGTERLLMALAEEPEWCMDMFNHELDMDIALGEMLLAEGYTFDAMWWWDDLGYKAHTFMSPAMYRELLKPVHKRAIDWAHSKGMKACLHSCGDIHTLIPDFLDIGLDSLNPLEVKAGVDTLAVKRTYGDKLVLHGGMNAVLWSDPAAMEAEIRSKLPALKKNGGYVWATDHSIPDVVSLQDFKRLIDLVKELGAY